MTTEQVKRDPKVEADKLRAEAKAILNKQILALMGIHNDGSNSVYGLPVLDRFVDCVISAAILETTSMIREVLLDTSNDTSQQTKESSHSCGGSCSCNKS